MEDGDDVDVSLDASSKRACDTCRTRKTRCDRVVPCSSCRSNKLACTTTLPAPKAQRQRVHISEAYEKKIDRIEDRLSNIENILARVVTKLDNLDIQKYPTETRSESRTGRVGTLDTSLRTPAFFEGETTINSQSDHARELLAQAIDRTPSIAQNAEIQSALTALGELVSRHGQNSSTSHPLLTRSLVDLDYASLDRPPFDEVIHALDQVFKYTNMSITLLLPFFRMKNLIAIIEDAYQNPASCSAARRVIAYGVMDTMFSQFKAFPAPKMDASRYGTYAELCKRHLEVAMSELDILMPASHENIAALVLGAAQAIGVCKPSLCWIMISNAANMCQNLGYHRINTMSGDTLEERNLKIHTFWMIYTLDKTLSLRLGRASIIQDWEISLPFFLSSEQSNSILEEDRMLVYWIKVARVQGQIYEKLFCPAAFLKSPEERTRTAIELSDAMNGAWYDRGDIPVNASVELERSSMSVRQQSATVNSGPNETELPSERRRRLRQQQQTFGRRDTNEHVRESDPVEDIFFHSDAVVHYSTCALIQRAVSPDNVTFNHDCLQSSRAALAAHMRANAQFNSKSNEELWSEYIHWSILQAPFTPFIVLFCNAIQNTDSSDLNSLSDFVVSLEPCQEVSEGAGKLYKMCHLLQQVAKLYFQLKTQDFSNSQSLPNGQNSHSNDYTMSDSTQIDFDAIASFNPYLSALGLIPNPPWSMAGDHPNGPPMTSTSTSTSTDAFFYGQDMSGPPGNEMSGLGLGLGLGTPGPGLGGTQNFVQDWFLGSRYLMNLTEAGDELQMPDLNL